MTLQHLLRLAQAQSAEALWGQIAGVLAGFGFDRISYGLARAQRNGLMPETRDILFFSNHPGEEARNGLDAGFFMRTPMFRWVMQNTGACSWQWAEDRRRAGLLTEEEAAAQAMARKAGLTAGYTISFADPLPRNRAAMSLAARGGMTQAQVDASWQVHGAEILALCHMMHLRMLCMPFPTLRRPLSPRQREALEWVAEGKTTQDIATIMGVSPAMVEKHLRLAREALDVETTAHAVAKATLLNHLFPGNSPQP